MKTLQITLMAFVLVFSSSCMMMHHLGMPMMNDTESMDNTQPYAMDLTDPVCGIQADANTGLTETYEGRTYYFDSGECLKVFQKNPERFAKKERRTNNANSGIRRNEAIIAGGVAMVAVMVVMLVLAGGGH